LESKNKLAKLAKDSCGSNNGALHRIDCREYGYEYYNGRHSVEYVRKREKWGKWNAERFAESLQAHSDWVDEVCAESDRFFNELERKDRERE